MKLDAIIKLVGAVAALGVFGLAATIGNRALESYVSDLVAQEAASQDVSRAAEVKQLRTAQESGNAKLDGIESLLRRQDDRAESAYCRGDKYPDLEGEALRRRCEGESEERWVAWARADSVAVAALEGEDEP